MKFESKPYSQRRRLTVRNDHIENLNEYTSVIYPYTVLVKWHQLPGKNPLSDGRKRMKPEYPYKFYKHTVGG